MDEMNNKNIRKPVAKAGGTKNNTENQPSANTENTAENVNIFSAVYQQQKEEQQQQEIKPVADTTKEDTEKKKFNTIFIILIIITVGLFLASCIFLIVGALKDDETSQPNNDSVTQGNTLSAQLTSPFDFQQIYPVNFPEGIQEKYKDLYAQNQDFVGWLTVPGTSIDTPVYKTTNNSYYLKHDNYDAYTKYGIPFLDMYCGVQTLSKNSTIYGHNFDNGLIFDELHNYQDLEFFKENPVIEYNTLYKDYKWKVIAAFHTNGSSTGDNGYLFYYIAASMGNNSFMEFYDELQQRSYIHTGGDVQPTDKILTLSTCTYFFDKNGNTQNARFAVVARLVRDGESEEVDVSLATENENVRYPQLYYDVFGGTNPYRNASQWEARTD